MHRTYQDKTVLITGASSGIGAEFARQLHALGAQLILTARSVDKLRKVQAACPGSVVIPGDLTDPGFPARLHAIATGNKRRVDMLINNAGYGYVGLFHEGDLAWQLNMIQLNIAALTELTYRFLPQMLDRPEDGCGVINVASVAGFLPIPNFNVYAATKAYVQNFSQALWQELQGQGVTVTCLSPGTTRTNFQTEAGDAAGGRYFEQEPATVVQSALKGFQRGRRLVVTGAFNRLAAILTRLTPIGPMMKAAGRAMKRV